MLADLIAEGRQGTVLAQTEEQLHRSQRRCREQDVGAGKSLRVASSPCTGTDGLNLISGAAVLSALQRLDVYYLRFGKYPGAMLFGEIEIVQIEGILRTEAASHDAPATRRAGTTVGTFTFKVRIGNIISWRLIIQLKNTDAGIAEASGTSHSRGGFFKQVVGRTENGILHNSQHARSGLVVLRHFVLPVSQTSPHSGVPNGIRRRKQGRRVSDGSAPDSAAMENRHVSKQSHVEKSAKTEPRTPEPSVNGPARARKGFARPAAAHFHHANPIAFFGQAMRRNATPEARADHDEVEIELGGGWHNLLRGNYIEPVRGVTFEGCRLCHDKWLPMRKLAEVEEARSLMREAMDWSVFKWLFEKHRMRETADRANAALDTLNRSTKAQWNDELKAAYRQLAKNGSRNNGKDAFHLAHSELTSFVKKVIEADDAARRAREDAQQTFDYAEREMSTALAREGCSKAIHQWELDKKAIRVAQAVPKS